ncbi:unnamed protein product [Vitrella brassicaformis CCMP3155]|uniref:DNA topoisomerase 2 n=2 Tax=Vitrella brassicaformis TaxID=1169539 RepID=A0A0G4G371_VITBC|nr:unnamed protein product [Vitrella brassicaformis CCMP3155]|eukprot:CEM22694.1 unnamed protein product [Vitrella brassicaformis CCMP3155]
MPSSCGRLSRSPSCRRFARSSTASIEPPPARARAKTADVLPPRPSSLADVGVGVGVGVDGGVLVNGAAAGLVDEYTADQITVLEGLEPVRKRPGMYIGSTGVTGYHHLVWEVVDNAVDEALAGHCNHIHINLHTDGSVSVSDNGRGIPCDIHRQTGRSALETVMTVLHAGGKFGNAPPDEQMLDETAAAGAKPGKGKGGKGKGKKGGSQQQRVTSGYKVSGGLHGVGVSVVNALSQWLDVQVNRGGHSYSMGFERGKVTTPLQAQASPSPSHATHTSGTTVRFLPDPSIFKEAHLVFDYDRLKGRCDELTYLNPGLTITLRDFRDPLYVASRLKRGQGEPADGDADEEPAAGDEGMATAGGEKGADGGVGVGVGDGEPRREDVFHHSGGLVEYLHKMCEGKTSLHPAAQTPASSGKNKTTDTPPDTPSPTSDVLFLSGSRDGVGVEVALGWYADQYRENLIGYVNGIKTKDGGTHIDGVKTSLTKVINNFIKKNPQLAKRGGSTGGVAETLGGDFIREGLTCIVSVKVPNPEFEGQTKNRLGNPEIRTLVDAMMVEYLTTVFEWQPKLLQNIVEKAASAKAAAEAARAARDLVRRKSTLLQTTVLPGKLADCSNQSPEESEIFIVEGDSAAGSAKQGRDRRTQAILPLRGKILNIAKVAMENKIYQNKELQALIAALGLGVMVNGQQQSPRQASGDGEGDDDVQFDKSTLRYHRIIIMTDADVDGAHIRLLLLTFFYRYQRSLIQDGFVYIACPPLYKVNHPPLPGMAAAAANRPPQPQKKKGGGGKKGPTESYAWTQEELIDVLEKIRRLQNRPAPVTTQGEGDDDVAAYLEGLSGVNVQRFKGLGEMMALELWDTTMNPDSRLLKKVTVDDALQADRLVGVLMGDNVVQRKDFISQNAQQLAIEDLDY